MSVETLPAESDVAAASALVADIIDAPASTDLVPIQARTVARQQPHAEMIAFETMEQMAGVLFRSGIWRKKFPSYDAILAMMLFAQSEGLHPMQAVRRYHFIDGNAPSMSAEAMLASFQSAGGSVLWGDRSNEMVEATFRHPNGITELYVCWTIDDARQAGLLGKATWQKHPRQLLTARVIGEGVRSTMPEVVLGIYSPDEAEEILADSGSGNGNGNGNRQGYAERSQQSQSSQRYGSARNGNGNGTAPTPEPRGVLTNKAPEPAPDAESRRNQYQADVTAAKAEFDRIATENGLLPMSGKERGMYAAQLLGRDPENPGSMHPADWREAASRVADDVAKCAAATAAATAPAPPVTDAEFVAEPPVDRDADLSDPFENEDDESDPFAETEDATPRFAPPGTAGDGPTGRTGTRRR